MAMAMQDKPRNGTKRRITHDLLHQPGGAMLAELNLATGWDAFSYINDTKGIAANYGGTPQWKGEGQQRRFWID
jgi:hypothetical protein